MEHRWSERRKVRIPALVDAGTGRPVEAVIGCISRDGAFLELGAHLLPVFPLNAVVTLTFRRFEGVFMQERRLRGMVVRHAGNGVGLMFVESEQAVVIGEALPAPMAPTGGADIPLRLK